MLLASKNYAKVVEAVKAKFSDGHPKNGSVSFDTVEVDDIVPAELGVIRLCLCIGTKDIDLMADFKDGSSYSVYLIKDDVS